MTAGKVSASHCAHCAPSGVDNILNEKLYFSIAATILIMLFSMQEMIFGHHIVSPSTTNLIMLVLATPIQFWAGYHFHERFLKALKNRTADMNTLISIGTNVAYFYSVYLTLSNKTEVSYYDTSAMIITIVLIGSFLESKAKAKASDALSKLIDLAPKVDLKVGDSFVVKPGEKIATDGVVLEGTSAVDEALITGESVPVDKKAEDRVFGGTINKTGALKIYVDIPMNENTLTKIAQLLEDAQMSKPAIQRLADTISKYFVPIVILLAIATFILWSQLETAYSALPKAIAVIIVSCPCALGLATPIAIIVFLGIAFRHGIIIKETKAFETLAKVDTFVFDKTGTLTNGSFTVTDIIAVGEFHPPDLMAFASSAEKYSEHPIAKAILAKCMFTPIDPQDFRALVGFGVMANVGGKSVIVGNIGIMEQHGINVSPVKEKVQDAESQGKTVIFVAVENTLAGIITVQDTLKSESPQVIQWLKERGFEVAIITGDSDVSARATAKEVGINNVFAKLTPEDKVRIIKELRAKGKIVAMVGDGLNDAPALASANVGIAIDAAIDIAKEASDITLTSGNLTKVIDAIQLSRKAVRAIKQNLWFAFAYNVILIPIAAGALYKFGLTITPEISAVAMSLSSITVVGNSIRQK